MLKRFEIVEKDKNTIEVILVGNLYVEEATELRERLITQIEEGIRNISFDFKGLDYIDSSGLGVLIAIQKRCVQKMGRVNITGLKGNVLELFELTRLTKVFDIQAK